MFQRFVFMDSPAPSVNPKYLWRNISRADTPKRSVTERVADFLEVYCYLDEQGAKDQASRCLQCPDPPCIEGCPMGNRIPEWLALVSEGEFKQASDLLSASGCMPDIVSRLCRQMCEQSCVLEALGGAIAINAIERFLNYYAREHELGNTAVPPPNGFRVAVVGSGPCGLACSVELVRLGYTVVVFDSHSIPGGFLLQGIPPFKLDKTVVQGRIQQLQKMGVEFRMNIRWGQDLSLQGLRSDYDAVFLGPCPEKAKPLTLPGADLAGVQQGLDFILQRNFSWAFDRPAMEIRGKRVVVLGGGDLAVDCLRTAIRSGAAEAIGVYRRDQASMPCHPREFKEVLEEGGKFIFSTLAVELRGQGGGVSQVRCVRTQPGALDASGRPEPVPVSGSEFEVPADLVLAAFGFAPPAVLGEGDLAGFAFNGSGGIRVDQHQMTSIPGVFAAGVVVRPATFLAEAVRDARAAAAGISGFISQQQRNGLHPAVLK